MPGSKKLSGSDESLSVSDIRNELEYTRTSVDRLDRQVSALAKDVASLSTDVKQILQLLKPLPDSPAGSPTILSPTSLPRERHFSFNSGVPFHAKGHRDSVSSAPGLCSGTSLVGILKSGDRTPPAGTNRVDFVPCSQESRREDISSCDKPISPEECVSDSAQYHEHQPPEGQGHLGSQRHDLIPTTDIPTQKGSSDDSGTDSPQSLKAKLVASASLPITLAQPITGPPGPSRSIRLRSMGDSQSSRSTHDGSIDSDNTTVNTPFLSTDL